MTGPGNEHTNEPCTRVDYNARAEILGTAVGTDESRTPVNLAESEIPMITNSQCSDTCNKTSIVRKIKSILLVYLIYCITTFSIKLFLLLLFI